ncbi:hypothetical protein CLOM_g2288 [Closterium sp. NIES-68]|nr:hypothetical protein CLOM_g2288 [Closterium sp. NIES-68]GJP84213.1 hypothetical protein CLOP_g14300 [Closterium sp. NIES-67]
MAVESTPLTPSDPPPSAAAAAPQGAGAPASGPGAAEKGGGEAESQGGAAAAEEKGNAEAWGPKGEAAAAEGEGEEAAAAVVAKHPLQQRWTLWFDCPHRGKSGGWGTSMRQIYTFGTVEDFWSLYNNVNPASKLGLKMDMHLFKAGIVPKWEDPQCEKGGSWTVMCRTKEMFDHVWLNVLLALIGEQFTEGADICGAVANARQNKDRVAIWTKTASNEAVQMSIGRQLKEILNISDRIAFSSFADQKVSSKAGQGYFA